MQSILTRSWFPRKADYTQQKPTHSLDCPSQFSWVSRSRYLSGVGQQLPKCWSATPEHCSAALHSFRKHTQILLRLFPKSKNLSKLSEASYSRTINLPVTEVQWDELKQSSQAQYSKQQECNPWSSSKSEANTLLEGINFTFRNKSVFAVSPGTGTQSRSQFWPTVHN